MNSLKLTKVVCLGSLGCFTAVSLYYRNNKDNKTIEYLQQQQFRDEKIDALTAQNKNLKAQLGATLLPVSGTLVCPDGRTIKNKNSHWSNRSFTLRCQDSVEIPQIFKT